MAAASSRRYDVLKGVPVLRDGPAPVIQPVDHVSNAIDPTIWNWMMECDGPVLFLGAGATDVRADHIVEVEYNLFRNTDIIADAHFLPLKNNSFKAAVALNVFEHLSDPARAAEEIKRVLQPNGEVLIHTAFMQPLHEAPHHYYNATEFGVRNWFKGYESVEASVTANFNPAYGVSWLMNELLIGVENSLGADARHQLERMTLNEVSAFWSTRQESSFSRILTSMPETDVRKFAAGFQLRARKGNH
ncbi:class I SAM-dependent methyltransferase [Bosea sp. RCC_152_1]|uniref:class I SAM-dependent methyltransferase n=1 Tax=Bosea sp. RCC_152_1 TaxID=3239228 RepID=UPI00352519F5